MIGEIDDAIRALVKASDGIAADIDVALDAPTKDWAARRNAPTVDLFLYDIREDTRRREYGFSSSATTAVIVTQRTPGAALLQAVLPRDGVDAATRGRAPAARCAAALLPAVRRPARPFVVETLAETGLPCSLTVALPPPEDRAFADVWSALGGELKPSLDLVVTAPVARGLSYPAGPPVTAGVEAQFSARGLGIDESAAHAASRSAVDARRPAVGGLR